MSIDYRTGEIIDVDYGTVRRSVEMARESGATFFEQIVWQIEHRAWDVLGHADWDAMREAEYGDMGVVVPRADRPEIVSRMRRTGLTQQQISETLGVSEATVRNDLNRNSAVEDEAPVITNARGQQRPASYSTKPPASAGSKAAPAESEAGAASGDEATAATPQGEFGSPAPSPAEEATVENDAPRPAEPSPDVADFLADDEASNDLQFVHSFITACSKVGEPLTFKEHRDRLADLHSRHVGAFGLGSLDNAIARARSTLQFLEEISASRTTTLRRIK